MIYNFTNLKQNFLTKLILLFFGFSLLVTPWSYRNYNQFDTFQLTLRGGSAFWMAADFTDASSKTIFKNFIFNFSEYLGSQIYRENSTNPQKVILGRVDKYTDRINELKNQGFTDEIIENMMAKEAMLKIIKNPITYSLQRLLELQKQISFLYIPSLNQYNIELYLENKITKNLYLADHKYGNLILSLIRLPFKILSYIFFILTIYAIIKNKNKLEKTFFPSIIILYTLTIYSLLFGLGRYGVPLIPFYVIFSSWAILKIAEKISRKKLEY